MIRRETLYNILTVGNIFGSLKKDQIFRFFSSELETNKINFLLNQLEIRHWMIYDENTDLCTFVGSGAVKFFDEEDQRRMTRAFWVLAEFGSAAVKEVRFGRYPVQYKFAAKSGSGSVDEVFDVTVIESEFDALLAQRFRGDELIPGQPDFINHIAFLSRESDAKFVLDKGFDSYALLDKYTGEVRFVDIKN